MQVSLSFLRQVGGVLPAGVSFSDALPLIEFIAGLSAPAQGSAAPGGHVPAPAEKPAAVTRGAAETGARCDGAAPRPKAARFQRWTLDDDILLLQMRRDGASFDQIGARLGRTGTAAEKRFLSALNGANLDAMIAERDGFDTPAADVIDLIAPVGKVLDDYGVRAGLMRDYLRSVLAGSPAPAVARTLGLDPVRMAGTLGEIVKVTGLSLANDPKHRTRLLAALDQVARAGK
ncbi:MAG: hypothetical protein Q4G24_10745 [Paracoccus sp. (in: a-proteobacteria)]|uniref:hypothetical protein n=1 Tax=Paracoccus sp. TaxID=267 RepID=UPI0026DF6EB2|nr:hypothetical protein [Paracoccus sp. (in: a-proteobacteria)]MDO5621936.1 hypothetical protein [Paracoccus sp. (in: a-proteobacteria)]